jgi:hypothetical protein
MQANSLNPKRGRASYLKSDAHLDRKNDMNVSGLVPNYWVGSSMMNFVPFSFSLSKEIVPFIASIIRLEAAKPNP